MPNIAAVTFGFSIRPSSTALGSVAGRKRSTGEPGASASGSLPMIRRKFERVVVRLDFGGQQLGLAGGELRFRLRDVGAGDLADIEAVLGLLQRLFEHADVAVLNLDDGGVAQIVHVDGGGDQQHGLLEHAQRLARAGDLALRRAGPVGGLLAVEQRLLDRDADAARRIGAVDVRFARSRSGLPPDVMFVSVY